MRVCIAQNVNITEHLALSTYLRNISNYLAQKDNIEIILLSQKGSHITKQLPENIKLYEINGNLYSIIGNIRYCLGLNGKLREINEEKRIDIIHCLYPNSSLVGAFLFKRATPAVKILYDIRSPWIDMSVKRGSVNRYISSIYKKAAYFSEKRLSHHADGFIFITKGLQEFYSDKINPRSKPVAIIPSGIDLELFSKKSASKIRDKYNLDDNNFVIGYVGGISRTRRLDFVLRVFSNIPNAEYRFMFVGDGDDRKRLETLAKDLRIQDRVIFTGSVPYERVPSYISAFNAGLCHLPDELIFRYSFPMKILEYLACGIPVLASKIDTHQNISRILSNVHIYNSPESFIQKAEEISLKQSVEVNLEQYRWESICNSIVRMYEQLLLE
jgi:glycosyltransferase involved in cell wall biosynthesis